MTNKAALKEICYKSTDVSETASQNSINKTYYTYVIDIKASQKEKLSQTDSEYFVYLNIIFSDSTQLQTSCVNIFQKNQTFSFKLKKTIQKIEIISYDLLKKLNKIGLKGASRDFDVIYKDNKTGLAIRILKKQYSRSERKQRIEQFQDHEQVEMEQFQKTF